MNSETDKKTILIIYEKSCADEANRIYSWILSKGIAHGDEKKSEKTSGLCQYDMVAETEIAANAAIILISDAATRNPDWQNAVRLLPDTTRLIPVGGIQNVDYNDPKVVPPCIEEINFIAFGDNLFENILDSLITSPDFFSMKNQLLNKCNSWKLLENEGDLLTNIKDIQSFRKIILRKKESEKDDFLNKQLADLLEYLDISEEYTKKIRKKRITRWIRRGVLTCTFVAFIIVYFSLKSAFHKATNANLLLSTGTSTGEPMVNAIKMVESITNPVSTGNSRKVALERLVEYLDKTWYQNPIGINYKYSLSDCSIPAGSRYLWTSSNNGDVILWDTYDGTIISLEHVSDNPLTLISENRDTDTENEETALDAIIEQPAVTIDSDRNLFFKVNDIWTNSGIKTTTNPEIVQCVYKNNRVILYDNDKIEVYEVNDSNLAMAEYFDTEYLDTSKILVASILSNGSLMCAVADSEGRLSTINISTDNTIDKKDFSIQLSMRSEIAAKDDLIVLTDVNGQTYVIEDFSIKKIPLVIKLPISLEIVNDNTIIYHERNKGTRVYNIDHCFDFGPVLDKYTVLSDIYTSEELLVLDWCGSFYPISWKDILPMEENIKGSELVFDEQECLDYTSDSIIKSAAISEYGLIKLAMDLNQDGSIKNVVLDPARVLSNLSGYTISQAQSDLPEEYSKYNEEIFSDKARPNIIGLYYAAPNEFNNTSFSYLLIGMNDGMFVEIGFEESSGDACVTCIHQIPSRSPITSIYKLDGYYYLKDKEGLIWRCTSGINIMTKDGIYGIVKEKINSGISKELWDLVSSDVRKNLELHVYPGGDGKEWE